MRIARDGLPYDLDNMMNYNCNEDEIEIIQYLRPMAIRRRMICKIGKKLVDKVNEMQLVISAEDLNTGMITIYIRKKNESCEEERTGLAENHQGENDPQKTLIKMLEKEINE